MRQTQDTAIEALMEQLIENGSENMASVFAGLFDLAMRIERERYLGAGHYERTPGRIGYGTFHPLAAFSPLHTAAKYENGTRSISGIDLRPPLKTPYFEQIFAAEAA